MLVFFEMARVLPIPPQLPDILPAKKGREGHFARLF